ncbi:hypothetical protein C1E24_10475 [Pseudoalteromonas phenolica]|uniref:SMODS and SLOG-associating 2TM effector domain-containing protein n=1 Tax=Pseudoalteromonas phenolica TaxID=161398 RepID=A0A5R9Q253_9GAMM|nr:SLATT domain-containing protein [Pseudoalteromonas phenolica]TLX47218.1 hypothetical protein C1E24_10475 [Pseudoalteromonas phenolica]
MKSQLENLYRRAGITKESCFQANRRLERHNTLSLWSLTILAFSLIVISLLTQLYAHNSFIVEYSRFLGFSITSISIFAMVIAVVVQKSNFSLKADKFRRQAMEINELRLSFKHLIDKEDDLASKQDLYECNSSKYSQILNRNLVHDQIDYYVSSSEGVEHKYYSIKLFITEFLGYILTMLIAISLLSWACFQTYSATITAIGS